jgi:hypothetical protein
VGWVSGSCACCAPASPSHRTVPPLHPAHASNVCESVELNFPGGAVPVCSYRSLLKLVQACRGVWDTTWCSTVHWKLSMVEDTKRRRIMLVRNFGCVASSQGSRDRHPSPYPWLVACPPLTPYMSWTVCVDMCDACPRRGRVQTMRL